MSVCTACQQELPAEAFRPRNRRCKACEAARERDRRRAGLHLEAKRRYQQSEKGKATARQREERPDVLEKRRLFAASPQGRANQAKYASTEKGKATHRKAFARYLQTEKGRQKARENDRRRWKTERRQEQRKAYYARYRLTEKAQAARARHNLRRRLALGTSEHPLTSTQWLEILNEHKRRCFYCKERTSPLTMDHVIPLSKGGEHTKTNVVPACPSCNSKKHDKLWLLC
jgi:5-methylcytosine-specific restriction endonuclease McrA